MDKAFAHVVRHSSKNHSSGQPLPPGSFSSGSLNPALFNSVALQARSPRKAAARAALVELNESTRNLLAECFRQYGIETIIMSGQAAERLHKEKFEACVLNLRSDVAPLMEAARMSPSNSRCVIYGVGGNAQEAMRFSKYGINAMFQEPLERPAAMKLVRATQNLVLHEFRRYVRIPVMTEVSVVAEGLRFSASSIEMSSGGMSVKSPEDVSKGLNVEVAFSLLTLPRISVRGTVTWRKPKSFGVRFDPEDDRRQKVKVWIDSYLEN
jgi:Tfp pilus assembly protein PilZ